MIQYFDTTLMFICHSNLAITPTVILVKFSQSKTKNFLPVRDQNTFLKFLMRTPRHFEPYFYMSSD